MFRKHIYGTCVSIVLAAGGAAAEQVQIAALGDSLTQGYGLPLEDGFVAQLQTWLERQGADVGLINAGVSGDTTAGGRSRIDWTLTEEVDGLIVALGGNDVLRGIDPVVARDNLDAILTRAGATGVPVLLVGITVPANYGPDYQAAFTAIYPDLAADHGALLYPDFLTAIQSAGEDRKTAVQSYMQGDAIHPNRDGVARIVEGIGPSVLALIDQITTAAD